MIPEHITKYLQWVFLGWGAVFISLGIILSAFYHPWYALCCFAFACIAGYFFVKHEEVIAALNSIARRY